MSKDISGGGFVDYETNTCIKANCKISSMYLVKHTVPFYLQISMKEDVSEFLIFWFTLIGKILIILGPFFTIENSVSISANA